MPNLPPECHLRRATAQDIWSIRKLVFGAKLDPTQVRWEQFWIVECNGEIVGCGQLRTFEDAQELGSLVIARSRRNQGLGSILCRKLIQEATQPLYLECLGGGLVEFYRRFGFVPVAWEDIPRSLKSKFGVSNLAKTFLRVPVTFMAYSVSE
ncbi:GNAT family N-acetyltransferase [Lusitaniella coriacea LEGE 07157]|uniref:GNAT family N-acetyltransferase n=1 Tax=Lusitaniella coriacea LEGE 07157 TaxID=945747 RepID=A0A8J7E050_9CYAN|nr:GNAT family N-acetyltransferase [Lusitaniella coriacea]MBE9118613.1 GNAT family N-acetyltransferase [Lusitaniella coriacea LEGE 07157]